MKKSVKVCHLHIGMHKTGSSSIQEYLEQNRDNLGVGCYYANLGASNHTSALSYALLKNPFQDHEISSSGLSDVKITANAEFFKNKLNLALAEEYTEIIFSAEGFVKLSILELESFKTLLSKFVDDIRVYCYIREPLSYMESAFQQIVKFDLVQPSDLAICPNYELKFKKFETVFGKVNYRFFSKKNLVGGDVVKDFCDWLSLPVYGFTSVNVSLGALAVKFLYNFQQYRKKTIRTQAALEILEKCLASLPKRKLKLPAEDIDKLMVLNERDFKWIASRINNENIGGGASNNGCPGTLYGVFSEDEKNIILTIPELDILNEYVENETGLTVSQLINKPLQYFSDIEFRIRKVSSLSIVGWACYISELERKVSLAVVINGQHVMNVVADQYRADLSKVKGDGFVGYSILLDHELTDNDVLTVMCEGKVLFSGYM